MKLAQTYMLSGFMQKHSVAYDQSILHPSVNDRDITAFYYHQDKGSYIMELTDGISIRYRMYCDKVVAIYIMKNDIELMVALTLVYDGCYISAGA